MDALDFGREEIRSRLDNARFHPLDVHIDQINNPMGTQNFLQRNDIDNDTAPSGAVLDERSSAIRFGSFAPRAVSFPINDWPYQLSGFGRSFERWTKKTRFPGMSPTAASMIEKSSIQLFVMCSRAQPHLG